MSVNYKLDLIDKKILMMLIDNARTPFTDIAKKIDVSAGTIHVRVAKMEKSGLIQGSSLTLNYESMGYNFVAYVGIIVTKSRFTDEVIDKLMKIPYVTTANVLAGKYSIVAKIRAKDNHHLREVIFKIDEIDEVLRTESMISLQEPINDKNRLMKIILD